MIFIFLILNFYIGFSQDIFLSTKIDTSYWKKSFKAGLNVSQASYSQTIGAEAGNLI
jgi:hypothetical protein